MCGIDVSLMSPEESAQLVGVRPGQRHVADAEGVVLAQQGERVFDGVAAFDSHERGDLVFAVGEFDALGRGDEHHLVLVLGHLLLDGVNQDQRPARELTLVGTGIDPDGEELGAEVSLLRGFKIPVAAVERIGKVVVLVDKTLRRVGVGVDHDGGAFDLFGRKFCCHLRGRLGWSLCAQHGRNRDHKGGK